MSRPVWKGSISFGLVSIPVVLHVAENRHELAFHMLDQRDLSAIHNRRVSERTGQEVPFDDIVRGYEYDDGHYVVLSEDDFRAANVKATQTIEIVDFVKASEIEPVYFDKPYYVAPTKAGAKGYALLRAALERSDYVGIAKVVVRTRQHLAALVARGPLLVLDLLRFSYELRDPADVELPDEDLSKVGATEKELAMAQQLIEAMLEDWDPTRYQDSYHDDLMELIEKKVASGQVGVVEAAPQSTTEPAQGAEVVDLMALLKKSVQKVHTGAGRAEGRRAAAGKGGPDPAAR